MGARAGAQNARSTAMCQLGWLGRRESPYFGLRRKILKILS
jgi:hypothetical protein